jgi:hypothetical protein
VDRATASVNGVTEDFQELITRHARGGTWTRPGLGRRERSVVTPRRLILRPHPRRGAWSCDPTHAEAPGPATPPTPRRLVLRPCGQRPTRSAPIDDARVVTTWSPPPGLPLLDGRFPLPLERPFTLRAASAAGLTVHRLRTLERCGLIRRVVKGVYVAAQVADSLPLRAAAVRLVVPRTAVVTDWSACWFWTGIDAAGSHEREPELTVFHRHPHTRLHNGLVRSGSRALRPADVVVVDGVTLTTPLRTAWDLGRLVHRDRAIGGMDALQRHQGFTVEELVDGIYRFAGMRGVRQLRQLAPLVDGRAESPPESTLRLRWLDMPSLPRPTPQVSLVVGGREVYRIDLGVPELRYGCEYDGADYHLDTAADVRRRTDLLAQFGWRVDGVRRDDVFGPRRCVEAVLEEGVEQARRLLASPASLRLARPTG